MSRKSRRPRRACLAPRTTTTILLPDFRPVSVAHRRISRAGLNGIEAIERARRAKRSGARGRKRRPRRKR